MTDLTALPSAQGKHHNVDAKAKSNRDSQLAKTLGMKSWDAKKVRTIVTCYHCGKRRCIYSPKDSDYYPAESALQQKLETVSERYSCGDLLFDDSHRLSKVFVQKQALTCESQIEKGYYNNSERRLKLKPICIHCGEGGSSDFLYCLPELQERNMTDGYNCFPFCTACISSGKKTG